MGPSPRNRSADPFALVRAVGLGFPDVEARTRYDGSPMLTAAGCFMASLTVHPSAEPGTLVVRTTFEARQYLLDEAPQTYYLTDSHRRHPVVLVRLSAIDRAALRDLLSTSWRLTMAKANRGRRRCGR